MKSLKDFFSKPIFILGPFFLALLIVFIQLIYPEIQFPIKENGRQGSAFVGFPLPFVEVVEGWGVDGNGYSFLYFPLIIDIVFFYSLFLLLSYWIFKKFLRK